MPSRLDAVDRMLRALEAEWAARFPRRERQQSDDPKATLCYHCGVAGPCNPYTDRCPACGCRGLEQVTMYENPNCWRAVRLEQQDFLCRRCGTLATYQERLPGLTQAGVCPNCQFEPRSVAAKVYYINGTSGWRFDPEGAVRPNVICSRCAITSFWADVDCGCRVCGANSSRKLSPSSFSSWPPAETPYVCPACGSQHFGKDRVPSPLGCRCGCCPKCGYDPLSVAVPGRDAQGNPGMYAYLDTYEPR